MWFLISIAVRILCKHNHHMLQWWFHCLERKLAHTGWHPPFLSSCVPGNHCSSVFCPCGFLGMKSCVLRVLLPLLSILFSSFIGVVAHLIPFNGWMLFCHIGIPYLSTQQSTHFWVVSASWIGQMVALRMLLYNFFSEHLFSIVWGYYMSRSGISSHVLILCLTSKWTLRFP